MKLPDPNKGGNFTPTPQGQHLAVLTRLIDLGTQTTESQKWGVKQQHKILFGWEIPSHRIKWERDGEEFEGPVLHYERMTFSMNEKAVMRQRLESWRGRPFTEEEYKTFDMRTLLGVGAFIQISHDHKNGNTYANMQAIMLPPGGKESWPKPEGETIYVSLSPDEFDAAMFDKLSDGLKDTIRNSPEYNSMFDADTPSDYTPQDMSDLDDDIPF